ncbi:tetraacyldisaccharide 4'-kinase [Noviherbaspirillum aridicola]|uniref:Tetraacyldisaccharide 4'-kinase n=1 Tax=Noviherbaspirillum aridicola TaxID=2849687 RepID=A0ABQ4Q2U6_9BURK|nr:tetraacyldisaccharide 4'-kinase [Noviherbaspirillum aridicola]GIZ51464.1 tetraacyldisaccharide 4'-kinase [Noviherbaspirillum aridicola]
MTGPAEQGGAERRLVRAWQRRGPLACVLWPLSLLFGLLAGLRRAGYRAGLFASETLPVPVVVVGNIFVGGTGKTPFTIWLVEQLRQAGFHPGVISRGYGAQRELPLSVGAASSTAQTGDEPALIARRTGCPVVVCRDRVAAARALLAEHPGVDLIISDDGLQHYRLGRDVEVVLCDARGNGNGWLLPAGPLREPASRRRDFTVVNGTAIPPGIPGGAWLMRLVAGEAYALSAPASRLPLPSFAGRKIAAAAGIGNPSRFFAMLRGAGLDPAELPLPDHHDFRDNPFSAIGAEIILITEKDAVKCSQIDTIRNDPRIWVVPVTASVDPALAQRITEKCRGRPTA